MLVVLLEFKVVVAGPARGYMVVVKVSGIMEIKPVFAYLYLELDGREETFVLRFCLRLRPPHST